jgi:4-amino-4-deoxy-L-arabinose transferase-like glycosyltransferase
VPRLRDIPRAALIVLGIVLVVGGGIRVYETVKPIARLSADAQSYVGIGRTIANTGSYPSGVNKLRWGPGTPFMFAAAYAVAPNSESQPGAYAFPRWAQFLVSTGTILSVFLLAWLIAGPWAGVIAAAFVAFYPPLWWGPSNLLSEPLGAFLLTSAFAALAAAWRTRQARWFAISGAIFGLTLLTRTDLLFVPVMIGLLVLIWLWVASGWRDALTKTALLGGCLVLVILPWSIFASAKAGRVVPLTVGGGSAFFVGTYLPGGGSTYGLKAKIRPEIVKRYPQYKDTYYKDIPGKIALNTVAARHPGVSRDSALLTEARKNLKDAVLHHPLKLLDLWRHKFSKMWFRASLGGAHHPMPVLRTYHNILVIIMGIGMLLGIIRRRDPAMISILVGLVTATGVHMLAVAHGRYGLPLMPMFLAAGVAGWWTIGAELVARRRGDPAAEPPEPEPDAQAAPAPEPA